MNKKDYFKYNLITKTSNGTIKETMQETTTASDYQLLVKMTVELGDYGIKYMLINCDNTIILSNWNN